MTRVQSPIGAFPARLPELCILMALRNGRGPGIAVISAVNEYTGETCWNPVPMRINFGADPLETRWLSFRVKDVAFPNAGVYSVEFRYNDVVRASQSLIVTGSNS
jgi:hypothetical protein